MPDQLTPEAVLAQERELVLPSFNENDAIDIGETVLQLARERSVGIAVEVHRAGRLIFRAALPGTRKQNDIMMRSKRRVAERWSRSSLHEKLRHEALGTTFEQATGLGLPKYAAIGGAFPLFVRGADPVGGLMGVLVIAGLPHEQDHALAVEGLRTYLAKRR